MITNIKITAKKGISLVRRAAVRDVRRFPSVYRTAIELLKKSQYSVNPCKTYRAVIVTHTISNLKKNCLDRRMAEGLFFLAVFIISSGTNKWTAASEADDAEYCKSCRSLCFESRHRSLLPCTECTESEVENNRSFTHHCDHMKTLPWQREIKCDFEYNPLPRCQNIPLKVKCQNEQLGKRYHMVCGDVCTIVCPDKIVTVTCTDNLEWNDTIPDERQCNQNQEPMPKSSDLTTIIIASSVFCIAAVVITCIVLFIKFKCQKSTSRGSSTTSDSLGESVGDGDTLLPPGDDPPKKESLSESHRVENELLLQCESVVPGVIPCPRESSMDKTTEKTDSMKSRKILTDLLNDRTSAKTLEELFDQQSCFSKITWHVIALHLLGWTTEKVNYHEYHCRHSSACFNDSPTYKILQNLTHEGKGIEELIDFLECHQSCLKTTNQRNAIELLRNYRQNWYSKHKPVHSCEDKV